MPPLAKAAILVLPHVNAELVTIRAAAKEAADELAKAGRRTLDEQRDAAERAARLRAELYGAEQIVRVLGRLAKG